MYKVFALLVAVLGTTAAHARIYSLTQPQGLRGPDGAPYISATGVAIDGDSIIVNQRNQALLYRRDANDHWAFSRILLSTTQPATAELSDVAMKNFLAILRVGPTASIWQKINNEWVQQQTAAPITAPGGFAISTDRILVGGDGCTADGLIYQKNASTGIWDVTGRIPAEDGTCNAAAPRRVELNYDIALVRGTTNVLRSYRRNGTAVVWPNAGNITLTGAAASTSAAPALQKDTLVLNDQSYYRRTSAGWTRVGSLRPLNYASGAGDSGTVLYRDSLLLVNDVTYYPYDNRAPYLYVKNAQGGFDQVANAPLSGPDTVDFDISGRWLVVHSVGWPGFEDTEIGVHKLPADIVKPRAIANDFDARDVSDFTTSAGSQYTLAGNSANYLYRQSNLVADTSAVLETSDWTDYQSVDVDLRPNGYGRANSWIGAAVRYVDANNYYFASLGNDGILRLQKKADGIVTTLAQRNDPSPMGTWRHLTITAEGTKISLTIDRYYGLSANDTAHAHGRVALLTSAARADFDKLYVTPTTGASLLVAGNLFPGSTRPFTYVGGTWAYGTTEDSLRQTNAAGQALAIQGVAVDDQRVSAGGRIDSFASTDPVAWYGVIARYVDANNFYYASLRSSNQLQIRKVVNGVTTVLRATSFAAGAGSEHHLELQVVGNELTAFVDGTEITHVIDNDIPRGRFGVGTYRATATFWEISAYQP